MVELSFFLRPHRSGPRRAAPPRRQGRSSSLRCGRCTLTSGTPSPARKRPCDEPLVRRAHTEPGCTYLTCRSTSVRCGVGFVLAPEETRGVCGRRTTASIRCWCRSPAAPVGRAQRRGAGSRCRTGPSDGLGPSWRMRPARIGKTRRPCPGDSDPALCERGASREREVGAVARASSRRGRGRIDPQQNDGIGHSPSCQATCRSRAVVGAPERRQELSSYRAGRAMPSRPSRTAAIRAASTAQARWP